MVRVITLMGAIRSCSPKARGFGVGTLWGGVYKVREA